MSVTHSGVRLRRVVAYVVVFLGPLAWSAHAQASGCHVAQRPSFGLDGPQASRAIPVASSKPETRPEPSGYRQAPCPGETPTASPRHVPPASAILTRGEFRIPSEAEGFAIDLPPVSWPPSTSQPLDRPPRR